MFPNRDYTFRRIVRNLLRWGGIVHPRRFSAQHAASLRGPRRAPAVDLMSVAFHPATASCAMCTARTVPDPTRRLACDRSPSSASFGASRRVSRWCQSRSVRRTRIPLVCRSAILHPPPTAILSAPKDMSVVIGARSWARDHDFVRHVPARRRAM